MQIYFLLYFSYLANKRHMKMHDNFPDVSILFNQWAIIKLKLMGLPFSWNEKNVNALFSYDLKNYIYFV